MKFKVITKKSLIKNCINKCDTELKQRLVKEADDGESFTDDKLFLLINE